MRLSHPTGDLDMMPPEAPSPAKRGEGAGLPAVFVRLTVIAKRPEFLKAAAAKRQTAPSMLVQARARGEGEVSTGIRVGYTCSKKVGNSVARNRAKRRLREAARAILPAMGHDGWDYVLVGRPGVTAERPFDALKDDLSTALARIHGQKT